MILDGSGVSVTKVKGSFTRCNIHLAIFYKGNKSMKVPSNKRLGCARLLTLLAGFTAIPVAHSETILDVYKQAQQNDPVYLAGVDQYSASAEVYDQAKSALLPSVNFVISETKTYQDIKSADNSYFAAGSTDYPTTEYELVLNQSVYSYSNWAGFDKAKSEISRLDSELIGIQQDLIQRVAERYFAALAANENVVSINAEKKAVEQEYNLVKEKGTQLARKTDLLDAEARFYQVKSREIELKNRLQTALQELSELAGFTPSSLSLLGDSMKLLPPEPADPSLWLENALVGNPELTANRHAVEGAQYALKQNRGAHYPTVDLTLRHNNRDTEGTLFGGGSEVETQDIVLALNLPIYRGGGDASRIRESSKLYSKAQQEFEFEYRKLQTEIQTAYNGVIAAIAKVEAMEMSVKSHEQAVEARKEESRAGVVPSIVVLDAERDLFFARVEYSNARYDYILNTLRLKRASGSLSEADLVFVNSMLSAENSELASASHYGAAAY
jgi:outer membrane protein